MKVSLVISYIEVYTHPDTVASNFMDFIWIHNFTALVSCLMIMHTTFKNTLTHMHATLLLPFIVKIIIIAAYYYWCYYCTYAIKSYNVQLFLSSSSQRYDKLTSLLLLAYINMAIMEEQWSRLFNWFSFFIYRNELNEIISS